MEDLLGKTILGYRLVEQLGSGAYGTVYKAVKENPTGRYVRALKFITLPNEKQYADVLNAMGGDIDKTNAYFDQLFNEIFSEVQILNEFTEKDVPNVVRYYEHDLNVSDNPKKYNLYILMEYLTPLHDRLELNDFTVGDAVRMSLDILKGLSASHDNGVIHRDVKLDNIFVTSSDNFKIGDFGVSKILDKETRAQSLKGTPDFIAPEVYLGKEGYDKSVDLYSLGIVLYRLLNYNRNPFLPRFPETYNPIDEDNAFNSRMAGKTPEMPMLGGAEIGEVILKALAPREERFKTAYEFYTALIEAVNNTPEEELEVVINGEGTPFYNTYSSLHESEKTPTPSLNETMNIKYDPNSPNDNAKTVSNRNQANGFSPEDNSFRPGYGSYPNQNTGPYNSGPYNSTISYESHENPKKKAFYWIAAVLGVLAILAAAYFLFARNTSPAKEATPVTTTLTAPTYSIAGGQYAVPQYVKINDSDPNVKIYYTLDGTEPNEASMTYTNGQEIKVSSNTTLRSIAVDSDGNKSSVTSADYVISEPVQNNVADNSTSSSSSSDTDTDDSDSSSNDAPVVFNYTPPANNNSGSTKSNNYILNGSNSRVISESELYGLSEDEVCLARNEIFARKGREFDTDWIAAYFNQQAWYTPKYSPESFDASSDSILSDVEKQNVQIIQQYEQRMGYS